MLVLGRGRQGNCGLYCGLFGKEWVRLGAILGLARVNNVSGLWDIETVPSSLVPDPGGD